jgi:hypothetical protein
MQQISKKHAPQEKKNILGVAGKDDLAIWGRKYESAGNGNI